jgi:hypothetical protein
MFREGIDLARQARNLRRSTIQSGPESTIGRGTDRAVGRAIFLEESVGQATPWVVYLKGPFAFEMHFMV